MTAVSFDDMSSAEGRSHSIKSRKSSSRATLIGVGLAVVLSGTLLTTGHFSLPFVQFIAVPGGQEQDAASSGNEPPVLTPEARSTEHGDRLATDSSDDNDRGDRLQARGDRLALHPASIDEHRLAWMPSAMVRMHPDAKQHLLAPADVAEAEAAATVIAARMRKFTHLAVADEPPTENLKTALAAPSLDTDLSADIPHPSARPEIEMAAIAMSDTLPPAGEDIAKAVPVPSARPRPPQNLVQMASLEPEQRPGKPLAVPDQPRTADLPQRAPLPKARPARRSVVASVPPQAQSALAYAPPDAPVDQDGGGGLLSKLFSGGGSSQLPGPGSGIAVYDIKAATVYMPNGARLEAHSGLGHMQDDPRYVDQKSKGPTPPNVYNLVMRESRFHGVEAIRLLPADGKKKFGRDGLLAHTYMYRYGDSSQSNGCVVFENYNRFLKAFKAGKITRMVVVPSLDKLPKYMAAL